MRKLLSFIATSAILLNSLYAPLYAVAQEITPTPEPTPEVSTTPQPAQTPEETSTPTPEATIASTEEPTPAPTETPADLVTPTPVVVLTPETVVSTPTPVDQQVEPQAPESNPTTTSPPDSVSPESSSTPTPVFTPVVTDENAQVSTQVVITELIPQTLQENSVIKLITDKLDYAPSEMAIISGSGFIPEKIYSLTVSSTDDPATSTTVDVTTNGNGEFTYNYQLDGNYRPNYSVVVKDGEKAIASIGFTDKPTGSSLPNDTKLSQWETNPTGNWITGNLGSSNSNYKEGESVSFELDLSGVTAGTYNFSVCRNYQNGTSFGYLSLTPYNTSRSAVPDATITSTNGNFSGANVTINSVNEVGGQGGCNAGQRETQVNVTVNTAGNAFVLWGAHLASPADSGVGFGNGASSYTGSSLHMGLLGGKDVSINPAAIIMLATITVTKVVDSGSANPDQWCFNISPNPNTVTIPQCITSGQSTTQFLSLPTGNYQITETSINGYTFASGEGTNCTFNGSTGTASVTAGTPATNASCIFHNTQSQARITLVKTVTDNNGGNTLPTAWTLSATSTGGSISGTTGSTSITNAAVNAGTYTLSESGGPTGYTAGSWSCVKNGGNPVIGSSITLSGGDAATCTINNDDIAPKLTLVKNVTNADGGTALASTWTLSATGTNGFSGTGTQDSVLNKATLGPTSVTANVAYTLGESGGPSNYTAGNWSCNGGAMGVSAPTITLQPGQDVICSITNTHFKNSPTLTTVLSSSSIGVGNSIYDTATLTGATSNAGGSVTYNVYSDNICKTLVAGPGIKTVTNGSVPNSDEVTFTEAGDYYWQASYSGDTNNNSALSTCTEEHLVVNKLSPSISTIPNPTTALLGATITDTATLSGGYNPTGRIAFSLYDPDDPTCDARNRMWYDEVTVNGNGRYDTGNFSNTIKAGTWRWVASYSGDSNNNSVTGGCSDELVTINKADTAVATNVYNGNGQDITNSTDVLGANIHDSATVSGQVGVIGVTGTITYNFYNNGSCSGKALNSETTTISGYPFTTNSSTISNMGAGSYSYMATYSGDSNYNGSEGICEPFSIGKSDSSITTEVHNPEHENITNQTINPGMQVHDSATVLGSDTSFEPTGTVTYYFFTNGSCVGETTDSETVDIGQEATPRVINGSGNFSYQANYSGDDNFNAAFGECEPFAVGTPGINIEKTNDSGSGLHAGSIVTYTLKISNSGSVDLNNIKITDILPGGFTYILGSTTGATTNDPTSSGNILSWTIKSLLAGDSASISYKVNTATDLSDGNYKNFATCSAYTDREKEIFCNQDDSVVTIGSIFSYGGTLGGQVLGAFTELPDTGSPTWMIFAALMLTGTGIYLNIRANKQYKKYAKK